MEWEQLVRLCAAISLACGQPSGHRKDLQPRLQNRTYSCNAQICVTSCALYRCAGGNEQISTLQLPERRYSGMTRKQPSPLQQVVDTNVRGFSFSRDGPFNMRMDARSTITAERLVNTARIEELRDLFRAYANDNHAAAHASRIVATRTKQPIRTTRQLASAIGEARLVRGKRKIHSATLPFQVLRS